METDTTKKQLISLLERAIKLEDIGSDWDDWWLERDSKDSFTRYWVVKITNVEFLYPPKNSPQLFHPDGFRYLGQILKDLKDLPKQ